MKRIFTILFFALQAIFLTAQEAEFSEGRYRITFKDKQNSPYSIERPQEFLSAKAIERREKFNIPITEQDVPVNHQYLSIISDFGAIFCNCSKWFNSAIFHIDTEVAYNEISKLSFVKEIEYVAPAIVYKKDERALLTQDTINNSPKDIENYFSTNIDQKNIGRILVYIYGNSVVQNILLGTLNSHIYGQIGQDMTIAVIDAGFLHVDSAAVFQKLWDENRILFTRDLTGTKAFYDSSCVFESGGHGMMVLSLIGGFYPQKMIGTAPGAKFILLRSEEEETEYIVEEDNWVAAAECADSAGADIISTSLGYSDFDDDTQDHTYANMDGNTTRISVGSDIAASKGMLLINSAGNSGDEPWKYITAPADADSIITVGACKYNGKKTSFSSIGPTADGRIKPDVMALGLYPTIVTANGEIKNASGGTSFSCPLIAGCCATLWNEFPDSSAQEIKRIIIRSSDRYAKPNTKYGNGIPNVCKARAYCYAEALYKKLSQKYIMPDFDTFFEKVWKKDNLLFVRDGLTFDIVHKNGEITSIIAKGHDFNSFTLPDIQEGKTKLKLYTAKYNKTLDFTITPK